MVTDCPLTHRHWIACTPLLEPSSRKAYCPPFVWSLTVNWHTYTELYEPLLESSIAEKHSPQSLWSRTVHWHTDTEWHAPTTRRQFLALCIFIDCLMTHRHHTTTTRTISCVGILYKMAFLRILQFPWHKVWPAADGTWKSGYTNTSELPTGVP